MTSTIKYMTFDCHNPLLLAEFWSAVLEYETENWPVIDGATSKPRDGGVPHIAFIKVPEAKTAKNRLHLDIQPSHHGEKLFYLQRVHSFLLSNLHAFV